VTVNDALCECDCGCVRAGLVEIRVYCAGPSCCARVVYSGLFTQPWGFIGKHSRAQENLRVLFIYVRPINRQVKKISLAVTYDD
jgi:hypothetical protein